VIIKFEDFIIYECGSSAGYFLGDRRSEGKKEAAICGELGRKSAGNSSIETIKKSIGVSLQ